MLPKSSSPLPPRVRVEAVGPVIILDQLRADAALALLLRLADDTQRDQGDQAHPSIETAEIPERAK